MAGGAAPSVSEIRTPANILLVDDTPAKLLTYEAMLAELGENLLSANSANDAFEILLRTDVALVLADVMMPAVDGFEFAKLLRSHPRFQATPIIFVSATLQSDTDLVRGYQSGAVDYVTVPVVPELLRAKARVFLELHRLRSDLEERVRNRTAELAQSESRYRSLVENANDIVTTLDLNFRFTSVNPAVERILGYSPDEMVGTMLSSYVPLEQLAMHRAMLERKLTGETSTQYEMEVLGKDREQRFVLEVNSRLLFDAGKPVGIHAISRDITERKQAEARQLVLNRELQHRGKNLLAIVQSIVTNTLIQSEDLTSARDAIIGRLHALARAQDFVASGRSGGVPLRALVEAELKGFADRVCIGGIPVVLSSAVAQNFALVIHELATNAVKYGSLSVPIGRIEVLWKIEQGPDAPMLGFYWTERGGPAAEMTTKRGFGSQLIEACLGATPRLAFSQQGFELSVSVPFSDVTESRSVALSNDAMRSEG